MMLRTLADQVLPHYTPSARKDLNTAVKVLAHALGAPDPAQCGPALYDHPLPHLYARLDEYLTAEGKQHHTLKNTKNHISRLFRLSARLGLRALPATDPEPSASRPRFNYRERGRRPGSLAPRDGQERVFLPWTAWPAAVQEPWAAFARWATDPIVEGRTARWRKRPTTVESYRLSFEQYFGYLHYQRRLPDLAFDQLFDVSLIREFVYWHINERHQRSTRTIDNFFRNLLAFTNQYRPIAELRADILVLRRSIPRPTLRYNKSDAWVSSNTLWDIGEAIWPRKDLSSYPASYTRRHPYTGQFLAVRASISLMLRLWTFIPYRQRNMREMQLRTNLLQDEGIWKIRFVGEELKVPTKQGQVNHFELPFPPDLVAALQTYLDVWRPILSKASDDQFSNVFLTRFGTPYSRQTLHLTTARTVYSHTGKRWHPHIVRTVWATEWIRETHGDFYTAAIMLNDKLETVIRNYAHLLEEDVAAKAYRLIRERHAAARSSASAGG